MKKGFYLCTIFILLMNFSCENIDEEIIQTEDEVPVIQNPEDTISESKNFKILSLGDSYTIGQSVCETCRFPEQLKDSLLQNFEEEETSISLQVIARTGWTTTNLIGAIKDENIATDFDLVTLLIGVNNQFQRKAFSIYQTEFPTLVNTAIQAARNDKNNLIVISIPDYAYTPFGQGNTTISEEIDSYNEFAKNYCDQNGITFVNITDITREGLVNSALVASDNLHPSALAYTKFVERLLPFA
ncbi:MAG: acyl-CoA thioesterase-1, partial [Polaribacter sp.]